MMVQTSVHDIMRVFERLGVRELPGRERDHPLIQWGFQLCGLDPETDDETPWCSAILQVPAVILNLHRSASARARSWLQTGQAIDLGDCRPENDILILKRGPYPQPGPTVIKAPGHVTVFAGTMSDGRLRGLGGNQGNMVRESLYLPEDVLGYRRLR